MDDRRALLVILVVSGLFRLGLALGLPPGNDEAYHAQYAIHLDWCQYDHPPLTGLLAWIGLALTGGLDYPTPFKLRLAFLPFFVGSTWLMYRLTAREWGSRAGVFAALGLNIAPFFTLSSGTFALPDGPLLFFWLLTIERVGAALRRPGEVWPWIQVGLAWAGALESKYLAVFLPVGLALGWMTSPSGRRLLRTPGPWAALGCGLVGFLPVIAWNAGHHWISFAFQAGRAGPGRSLRIEGPVTWLLGQAAYLLPWMAAGLLIVAVRSARDWRGSGDLGRGLLATCFLMQGAFFAVSLAAPILPHWGMMGVAGLFPFLGRACAEVDWSRPWPRRLGRAAIAAPAVFAVLAVGQARWGWLPIPNDPTADAVVWEEAVKALERSGALRQGEPFLFTSRWTSSGQLGFAAGLRGGPPVACYNAKDARGFRLWSEPEYWLGRDGILVTVGHRSTEPGCFDPYFTRIELMEEFTVSRGSVPSERVRLFRCTNQLRPFPFAPLKTGDPPGTRSAPVVLTRGPKYDG